MNEFHSTRCVLLLLALAGTCSPIHADTFVYDDAGRLSSATQASGLIHTYVPDEESNLLSATHSGTDTTDTGGAGNGIPDWWEDYYFGMRGIDPLATPAGDGISNLMKYVLGLNPLVHPSGPLMTFSFRLFTDGNIYPYLRLFRFYNG